MTKTQLKFWRRTHKSAAAAALIATAACNAAQKSALSALNAFDAAERAKRIAESGCRGVLRNGVPATTIDERQATRTAARAAYRAAKIDLKAANKAWRAARLRKASAARYVDYAAGKLES